jgi:hypothetical protein
MQRGRGVTDYRSKRKAPPTPTRRNPDTPIPHSNAGGFTTKAPRHQGKIHREVGEEREERFSPQRHRGHEGQMRDEG